MPTGPERREERRDDREQQRDQREERRDEREQRRDDRQDLPTVTPPIVEPEPSKS